MTTAEPTPTPEPNAPQRVVKLRRDYNAWVASETLEDYALRFTPRTFRRWSPMRVANTAFGASSFLVLEAVGGTLLVQHGFVNAFWAILVTGLIIFLAGWPISVYAARHGVDMDLLTRGAGFGYLGSTVTSLVYASFTFIFFALEAAIMAYALELAFDIPPAWGYLICSVVVIPLVTHGVTAISRLQVWTQPLWLAMLVLPFGYVLAQHPDALRDIWHYGGEGPDGPQPAGFDLLAFGSALTVGIALITQMGEQADYLRFMPEARPGQRARWWTAVMVGGPGWVVPGVLKMLGGALLAWLALGYAVPADRAVDPTQMYLVAYGAVFSHVGWAVAATALFVVISQLKINVTNAYAGSLAWSNFFARLTHSHPGRVVWVVFNTAIALMLMELNVFQALGQVLGWYSNLAISWMMAVVADLVINKPMGWSPPGIEFRRAHLHDVNPVGVGAMAVASGVSMAAWAGWFGETAQAFSAVLALVTALVVSPLLAWATQGRWYLARPPADEPVWQPMQGPRPGWRGLRAAPATDGAAGADGAYARLAAPATARCVICERDYEHEDMAHCPAYQGRICSLCCSLDARCHDLCKPHGRLALQWRAAMQRLLPAAWWARLDTELGHYLMLMGLAVPALAALFWSVWRHEAAVLQGALQAEALAGALAQGYLKVFALLLVITAVVAWWLVLKHRSAQVAQEESNRQTHLLVQEVENHRRTDEALQQAKLQAEAAQRAAEQAQHLAELANQAKSRYVSAISHELRTPLNAILGYAQLLDEAADLPPHRRQAVHVIRRGGDHLLTLIEGSLDIARIESGKLTLTLAPMALRDGLQELVRLVEPQARAKGLSFAADLDANLPALVRADEPRVRQILLNLLGNAIKFTSRGEVRLRARHAREMATFEVEDTGPGMSEAELARVFEPFARGSAAQGSPGGTGLGLTISRMLTGLMGGELSVRSTPGQGTCFTVRLFLPEARWAVAPRPTPPRTGYEGPRRRILTVDNEEVDRGLLVNLLGPLGFEVVQAASGEEALERVAALAPDAILMDLAMPGIDGWQTIARLRAAGVRTPVAVVSANAFDKGLDNEVGITPADFITKPVRLAELLDWLGRALDLRWTHAAPAAPAPAEAGASRPLRPPGEAALRALAEQVDTGYVRGILQQLERIEHDEPASAAWVAALRELARGFRLDEMGARLARELAAAASTASDRP
jgi:signal transduction histidine kinase/purine-cytosine permease-like protein/DNA-binding NarL/FixJ family response regulator